MQDFTNEFRAYRKDYENATFASARLAELELAETNGHDDTTTLTTGGAAWSQALPRLLTDVGGDKMIVMFPPSRALMSHPDVTIYRLRFTRLDSKGNLTSVTFCL